MKSIRHAFSIALVWTAALALGGCDGREPATPPDSGGSSLDGGSGQESVIVDLVTGLSGPVEQLVTVTLRDHQAIYFESSNARATVWTQIIEQYRANQAPLYFEIEPANRYLVDVELPMTYRVLTLTAEQDHYRVTFEVSAAIHFLERSHPRFQQFLELLEDAQQQDTPVLVTDADGTHGLTIIDVRLPLTP